MQYWTDHYFLLDVGSDRFDPPRFSRGKKSVAKKKQARHSAEIRPVVKIAVIHPFVFQLLFTREDNTSTTH